MGRGGRNGVKRRGTPPLATTKKNLAQSFSPPPISITTTSNTLNQQQSLPPKPPSPAPVSRGKQRDAPTSPSVSAESLSGNSFVSTDNESDLVTAPHVRIPPIYVQLKSNISWRSLVKELYKIEGLDKVVAKTTATPSQIHLTCPDTVTFRTV